MFAFSFVLLKNSVVFAESYTLFPALLTPEIMQFSAELS